MFLMAEGEAALLEENAVELEGTLMSTSGVQHAALACLWRLSVSRMTSRWPQLGLTTRSAPQLSPMPFPLRAVQPCVHRLYRVVNHPRRLSNIARYPAIHDFATSLAQSQPSFAISSEKVHILSNPADFYTRLTVSH